jgi:lysophospholipase L1-like esterase
MPGHLGEDRNGDGLIDYANSAAEFREGEESRQGFEVDLEVRRALCGAAATYTWESAAGTLVRRGRAGCEVSQHFPSEGNHPVRLIVRWSDGRIQRFDRRVTVQDWLVVSIGDSVAAGEGNPDRFGSLLPGKRFRALWESPRCHRSAKAGPAQAALDLEAADPRTTTTFVHLACSGAEIRKGLLKAYAGVDVDDSTRPRLLLPQLTELKRIAKERQIDAVLLSIGANDVHFGPIVRFCLWRKLCMKQGFRPPGEEIGSPGLPAQPLWKVVEETLDRLPEAYAGLAKQLLGVTAKGHVLIVDYFDPTRNSDGEFCERIGARLPFRHGQIDAKEAEWAATKLLQPLNATLGQAAAAAGWTQVAGVAEAFGTHGYCARQPWIVHLHRSATTQKGSTWKSRFTGGFHPNEDGHRQIAAMTGLALSKVLYGRSSGEDAGEPAVVTVAERKDPGDGEGDLERTGGIVLGVMGLVLAALATALARRRPLPGDPWRDEPWVEERPLLSPPEEELDPKSVAAFGVLVEDQAAWVHRRVESIELVDERIVRRRVSVDFTPGAAHRVSPGALVPVALLSKQILSRFDLRDEQGNSVPLATSQQNGAYAASHMLNLAKEATGAPPSSRLRELCWQVARGEPADAWEALEEIAHRLEPERTRRALRKSDRFRAAASTFASHFAVMVEIEKPEHRRLIKFAYDQLVTDDLTLRQRLGLEPSSISIELPELGDARSRHIEFVRAEGLEFGSDSLRVELPDGKVIRRDGGRATGDPHLDISGMPRETKGTAQVLLRASRSGILAWGPGLSFLSALALTCAWFALPDLTGDTAGGAASILLSVPAAFAAYLSARPSHAMESALLLGARLLVFVAVALAFMGAAALAFDLSTGALRLLLGAAALLSWLPFTGLVVTYFCPQSLSR